MERAGVLNIESAVEAKREPGFWRRQFQQQPTRKQTVFDVVFGIALPTLCFIFDPIVFRGNFIGGSPLFGQIQFLAYAIAFIEISTLLIWLCARERLDAYAVTIGGFLYTGAHISLLIGIVLLPLSLIGLVFGIGILGFTPFVTFIIFWRNGRRAINLCPLRASRERRLAAFVLGIIFVIGGPLAAHLKISQAAQASLTKILEGDAREAEEATEQLRLISHLSHTNTDKIVWAYHNEQDQARRERLARAYLKLTGEDIEIRRTYLLD
jgi:hypothetical protein